MTNKKKRQAPKLKATGSLAKSLLPYDGRYDSEGGEPQGILSLFPQAERYKREQQIAKLPAVIAALELDRTNKDLLVHLLLALCERVFPIGFKEGRRGRHKENPERKKDAAFKMVHLYQVEMLSRGRPIPTWQACAEALSKRMRSPSMGPVGPALKAAINEAIDAGVTAGSIRRKGFDSPENAKREKVGIEAYQLGLNNALYPIDKIGRDLGPLAVIRIVDQPKPNGQNSVGLPLRKPTWGAAVIERLQAAGCICTERALFQLDLSARSELDSARGMHPGKNLIFARAASSEKGKHLAQAFNQMHVQVPVLVHAAEGLFGEGVQLGLVLLEDTAPAELLRFYDPSAPNMLYGILGLTLAELAQAGLLSPPVQK